MSNSISSVKCKLHISLQSPLLLLLLLLSLFSTLSFAFPNDYSNFLQCLDVFSDPQHPTSQVTYTQLNSSFPDVLQAYARNARFQQPQTPKPLLIVAPNHVSSIQATITCCKTHGLEMRTRSGGHDMEGLSYVSSVPFVILDMFNLRNIEVDVESETAWVQAGATLGEVYHSISQKSPVHAFPGGVCPTVGTTGHFSGGGYGNLIRKYGLSSDNIADALIVDVQGRVLNRKAMGEDLFWAIRGGGAASFGVIVAWQINLVRVPRLVTVFRVQRSIEEGASDTLFRWQEVAPNLPKDLFLRFQAAVIKEDQHHGSNKLRISYIGMYLGKAKQLVNNVAKNFPELKLLEEECIEMPWINSVLFWADFPIGTSTDVLISRGYERVARKVKSDFVRTPIPKEGLDLMWKELLKMDGLLMEWNPYGGRMSEISQREIAYPHREGNLFLIEYDFKWYEDSTEVEKESIRLSRKLYKFMTPYVTAIPVREAFFNYRDLDIGTYSVDSASAANSGYGIKYHAFNFLRLMKVKTEVDPLNFFRNEQSIPPLPIQKHT